SIGIDNSDDNKLKITSRTNHPTGASPSYGDQKMTITADGNIGIGTDNPLTKLQVSDGDIFISDIDRGIIMKSPDGKCWRGTLDNSGTLVFSSFDCPGEISFNSISKTPQEVTGSISIFPNPIDHTITIYSDSENLSKSTAIFYTTDGKVVRKDELNSNYNILNMTNIPAGSYIINVINKRGKILGHELVIKK
ncbi:MAG: T9SS type A sorting domain-containing protein, partial [Candidatus Atribacteria bacterium]|nr:T9SS type A sorting domain-containing protein [Candidatus Atribacteria bacterium]